MTCDWTAIGRPSLELALVDGWDVRVGAMEGWGWETWRENSACVIWRGSQPALVGKLRINIVIFSSHSASKQSWTESPSSDRSFFLSIYLRSWSDRIDLLFGCLGRSGFSDLGFVAWKDRGVWDPPITMSNDCFFKYIIIGDTGRFLLGTQESSPESVLSVSCTTGNNDSLFLDSGFLQGYLSAGVL